MISPISDLHSHSTSKTPSVKPKGIPAEKPAKLQTTVESHAKVVDTGTVN